MSIDFSIFSDGWPAISTPPSSPRGSEVISRQVPVPDQIGSYREQAKWVKNKRNHDKHHGNEGQHKQSNRQYKKLDSALPKK